MYAIMITDKTDKTDKTSKTEADKAAKILMWPPRVARGHPIEILKLSLGALRRYGMNRGCPSDFATIKDWFSMHKTIVFRGPRQSGHTTAIAKLVSEFSDSLIVTYNYDLKLRFRTLVELEHPKEKWVERRDEENTMQLFNSAGTKRVTIVVGSSCGWLTSDIVTADIAFERRQLASKEAILIDLWSLYSPAFQKNVIGNIAISIMESKLPVCKWPYLFLIG